ncbi:hypothetical protein ABIA32_003564 [Streptacidiphilus sp. MAP12-20]|uniref:serine protease inhibitor n=1 Tax=Streptacidiphilus sp. MAP12-20 TaxID=3156299 RepID=UPI00351911C2
MNASDRSRTEWPELVGVNVDEATLRIHADDPTLIIAAIPNGSAVTTDHRTDRVRLWFDEATQTVSQVPRIG